MTFTLHPQIDKDSDFILDLPLSQVRLINNARFPWVLLIPRQDDIKETIDLSEEDQQQLMREIAQVSKAMQSPYSPDKLNVAALGNMVPQLHVHVIARFETDDAWPGPIWGTGGDPYANLVHSDTIEKIKQAIENV